MCCEIVSEMFVKVTSNRTIKTVYIAKNKNISNIFPISISNITVLTNLKSPWIDYILRLLNFNKMRHVVFNP